METGGRVVIYDFEQVLPGGEGGQVVGIDFPIGRAPKIGSTIKRDGVRLRRIPSRTTQPQVIDYAHVDWALPRRELQVKNHLGRVVKKGVDPATGIDHNPITRHYKQVDGMGGKGLGRPVQRNRNDIRETFARDEVKQRGLIYDR